MCKGGGGAAAGGILCVSMISRGDFCVHDHHAMPDFKVLVYRGRHDEANIMGELMLRPDANFREVREIIAGAPLALLPPAPRCRLICCRPGLC